MDRTAIIESARQLFDRAKSYFSSLKFGWGKPLNLDEEPSYIAAVDYFKEFNAKEDADYSLVIEYMKLLYERLQAGEKVLEEKADALVKYLGGGTVLATFGSIWAFKSDSKTSLEITGLTLSCLLPAFYFAVTTIRRATKVREPDVAVTLPASDFPIKCVEHYSKKEVAQINVWLIYHPMCAACLLRNERKAELLKSAHRNYTLLMFSLVLPIVMMTILCLRHANL